MKIRKEALQNRLDLYSLTATQGGTCTIIHTHCCTYVPDTSTNITHFTKHMNKMIQAMDSPEALVTFLWETLISSPWWKNILIINNSNYYVLLFSPCICNCVTGFISNCLKVFKLKMAVQVLKVPQPLPTILEVPRSEILNMRMRSICCINDLGTMTLNSKK